MAKRGPKPKKAGKARPSPWQGFEPPAGLDADAAAEFARLAAALDRLGLVARTDPRIVVAAARVHSRLEAVNATLDDEGMVIKSGNGTRMKHPLLSTLNTLTMRMKTLWAEMGLTPASAKLAAPKADDDNPWKGLLNVVG